MATYAPPNNGYYEGSTYNSSYFNNVIDTTAIITEEYLQANYLQRVGAPTDDATITTFAGQINIVDSSDESFITAGGISVAGDITNDGNLLTSSTTGNLYENATTVNVGSLGAGIVNVGNLVSNNTTNASSSSTGGIITSGGIGVAQDIYMGGSNLKTSSTTMNVFNSTPTTVKFAGASTALTMGASTGTCTIRNASISFPNATSITASGSLNLGSAQTKFTSGTGYQSGKIVCCMAFQGTNYKQCYITCINASSTTSTAWTVVYTFPTPFSQMISDGNGGYVNVTANVADDNSTLTATTTTATIKVNANTTSLNSWNLFGW